MFLHTIRAVASRLLLTRRNTQDTKESQPILSFENISG